MNCFECAKTNDAVPAVGLCHHCGAGLCMDHLAEAREHRASVGQCMAVATRCRVGSRFAVSRRPSPLPLPRCTRLDERGSERATTDGELALLAKALAHPVRVHLLRMLLAQQSCYCKELVEGLPLAQPTVSQHLKVLKNAGLVKGEIEAPHVSYCADRAARLSG